MPAGRFAKAERTRELPRKGDVVRCRARQWLVETVTPRPHDEDATRVAMLCLDDDMQGRPLEVFWERELGARVMQPEQHGLGAIAGVDPPRYFAAYLRALKWNAVTATDGKLFQSPFLLPLHVAMRDRRVAVDLFLDLAAETEAASVRRFLTRNWPFGPPFPRLHYDPRTLDAEQRASLHAKCVVVDASRTLITSANFTDRGQSRNVELGVVIDDRDFGERVVGQLRALLTEGIFATASLA